MKSSASSLCPPTGRCAEVDLTYPHGAFVTRTVSVGGGTKEQLLAQLADAEVRFNEAARVLFSSDKFTTLSTSCDLVTIELAVRQLGFAQGATTLELNNRAVALGLCPAPLELGPYLGLQYKDQPEGYGGAPITEHRAPPGSVTVVSAPLSDDDDFPRGFYLRRIKGELWLRGYWCSDTNVWDADDHLVFCERDRK